MLSRSTAYDLRCPNVILCSHISGVSRPAELTSKVFLLYVHSWYSGVQKQTLKLCSMNKIYQIFEAYSPYQKDQMMKSVMVTKGQLISFWCLQFHPKNERKHVA